MASTEQWTDLLDQQYEALASATGERDLLLAMRRFVLYLTSDLQAQRFVEEMNRDWEANYGKWLDDCQELRGALSDLERRIRATGATIEAGIESLVDIPDQDAYNRSKHILDKIGESNWYEPWDHLSDDLDLALVHLQHPPRPQIDYTISKVLGVTNTLTRLSHAVLIEEETCAALASEAKELDRRYDSALSRIKNDWISSGTHALNQLQVAVGIMDKEVYIDPTILEISKVKPLYPWMLLVAMYAPSPDFKKHATWYLRQPYVLNRDFDEHIEPMIRSYCRQVYTSVRLLAQPEASETKPAEPEPQPSAHTIQPSPPASRRRRRWVRYALITLAAWVAGVLADIVAGILGAALPSPTRWLLPVALAVASLLLVVLAERLGDR